MHIRGLYCASTEKHNNNLFILKTQVFTGNDKNMQIESILSQFIDGKCTKKIEGCRGGGGGRLAGSDGLCVNSTRFLNALKNLLCLKSSTVV